MPLSPALAGSVGTLPLPNTAPTPKNGEDVRAEDVQNAVQALLDQEATLEAYINDGVHNIGPGGVFAVTVNADNVQATGPLGVELTGGQPAKNADPGDDNLATATNQCKAWGKVTTTNTNTSTLNDGYNVASVTVTLNTIGIVTFARPMANANYAVTMSSEYVDAYAVVVNGSQTTNGFHYNLWKTSDFVSLWNVNATGHQFAFHVHARQ